MLARLIRSTRIFAIVILVVTSGCESVAPPPPAGSGVGGTIANYTCSETKCSCTGAKDCLSLGRDNLCSGEATCKSDDSCSCDKKKAS